MNNLAQDVAYRVRQFNEAVDEELKPSIQKRLLSYQIVNSVRWVALPAYRCTALTG